MTTGPRYILACLLGILGAVAVARAGDSPADDAPAEPPQATVSRELRSALDELAALRETVAQEKIPLSAGLREAEADLSAARREYEDTRRELDSRNLDMNNLRQDIKAREQEKSYLSSLLGEYIRNLETRLHIVELNRYRQEIEQARLGPENENLPPAEVFALQVGVLDLSMERLEELLGGVRFAGRAAGEDGIVKPGRFLLLGPCAYFAADDGPLVGVAEQRLGSLEPSVTPYADPALGAMTRDLVQTGHGRMPFDGSLGNARKVEETRETFLEHIGKGGPVMVPIVFVAAVSMAIALFKWLVLGAVRMPPAPVLRNLFEAVENGEHEEARGLAARLPGPAGAMLRAGADHLGQTKELIEEVMFEKLLDTRFQLQKRLPLIAVAAACAPLLGLLGTVTGIINTFKLITVFGSGDVKMLSSGISEALITTECGLYIAIPSLLAHSFLSRRAKTLSDRMERFAIEFLNGVARWNERARA